MTINAYLADGLEQPGIGLFTLTQLASVVLILIALYMLFTIDPDQAERKERLNLKARGR